MSRRKRSPGPAGTGGSPSDEPTTEAIDDRLKRVGAVAWHARVREIVQDSRLSVPEFARRYRIVERTLQNWVAGNGVPSLSYMLLFHKHGLYPIADQLIDLCELQAGDLEPTEAIWRPQPSLLEIQETLNRALRRSVTTMPSLQEVAARIDESCWATQDYGRWRSRSFDVPMGWQFPHLGYRGVEFLPWYGPEQDEDPEPEVRRRYLELDELGYDQWWREDLPGHFFDPEVPPTFRPGRPPLDLQTAWDQCRHERMELVKRMGPLHAASQAIWYGAYGHIHAPLLWNGARGNVVGRHIFVQPVASPPVPAAGIPVLALGDSPVHTVLVLGTSSLSVHRVGQLIADALGWLGMDYRQFTQRLLGRRVGLGLHDNGDRDLRTLTYLQRPRASAMVLYANLNYFTHSPDGQPEPRPEALALLRQDGVLPILLTSNDMDAGNDTAHWWHQRQQTASWSGESVASFSDETIARSVVELWIDAFDEAVPNGTIAELQPAIPWAGPATIRPGHGPSAAWFHHPLVGDIQVRAAYEVASWLRGSAIPETKPNTRRVDFARDSIVDRYASALRACTGGDFLTAEPPVFDGRYLHAPDGPPATGRAIAWLRTPKRTPVTVARRRPVRSTA